ncbi:unnamed protein product [Parnassius apollo]|uniref:(apollo) hypothetical protein n=1 Tax=Parnassius apollo TaxID=110799 RepID=A0A8S3WJT1_PARAO|nr:unnamed protein product [Parnassius apollo]
MAGSTLPERVAQIYYTYGLFCSSYPVTAITIALSVVLLCCYPLLNVPLPGNIPTVVNLPLHHNGHNPTDCSNKNCLNTELQMEIIHNETQKLPYIWAKDKPLFYVHQIIMKIGVSPWNTNLRMWDAFRGPLQEVFRLLETIRNHEDLETKNTLLHHCYQIEGIKRHESKSSMEQVLPEYSCLMLSPANLWQQNLQSFSLDANIVNTIYNYQSLQKGKASIAEMAFGMHLRDTGIKRYPLRARPRVLQYAVTIFYQEANERFINTLINKLREIYPLHQDSPQVRADEVMLIYYPGQFNYHELVPLLITFFGLFLYVYFSVRKIEFIRSKFGLAACAVVTIAGSLSMSMGICFYFGFSLSLQGKEIFPYLVIIVGLENILVLTKSVTSTDSRLDVKIRLAQGLTKEGWSITKNLLTEITILTVSFFTFVPFIQEFSIFMIVSLISDYFIQMVFFATILGIDVRRMEYFPERNSKLHLKEYFIANNALNWRFNKGYIEDNNISPQRITKSKSHPRLNGLAHSNPTDIVAKRNASPGNMDNRVPKRIRLVNMWARTRFFQRAFMVWMIVWISMIVYNSGIVDYFVTAVEKNNNDSERYDYEKNKAKPAAYMTYNNIDQHPMVYSTLINMDEIGKIVDTNDTIFLKHSPHARPWSRLSPSHWASILSQYNESVAGKYAIILPPTLLSHRVSPELAAGLRHPDEKEPPPLRWQALAAALDPIDILPDFELIESKRQLHQWGKDADLPIYPTTPMEILLLAILCTISVAVIAYMMVVLYRCVCSRHYAEWRASWNEDEEYRKIIAKQPAVQLVMEAVPMVVAGHSQEVECLVTDGDTVVSSCLQGNIKVWDSHNGDLLTNIDRNAFFKLQKELREKISSNKMLVDDNYCNIVKVSPPAENMLTNANENVPRLRKGLSSHLSGLRFRANGQDLPSPISAVEATKYNFAKCYRDLYYADQLDCDTKENIDSSNYSLNKNDLISVKDKDVCDESIFVFNSSAQSSSVLRNRHDKKVNKRTNNDLDTVANENYKQEEVGESPVWCMDFCNDLIIVGCADGRLEFWEASSGKLMASSSVQHPSTGDATPPKPVCDFKFIYCNLSITRASFV